jgi:MinD-like ATPase involved in chromosome partitioning or flagellar assembly
MFNTIAIHAASSRAHRLRYLMAATNWLEISRDLTNFPNEHELTRVCGGISPEVVIIDMEVPETIDLAAVVREVLPSAAIVGYGPGAEAAMIATKVGFDITIPVDSSVDDLRYALQEALRKRQGGLEKSLLCFLPAKAGSGCSTIVLNTAAALARDQGKRVLVLDTDLRSGILSVMLAVKPKSSIQNLLAVVEGLDQRRFKDFVVSSQGVDYLVSNRILDIPPPEWMDYFHLLSITIKQYDVIMVDMPELINPATVELARRAREVYVVTTPEIPSLTLAKQRFEELGRLSIPKTRMGLLVNRLHRSDPSPDQIAEMAGHAVSKTFPNDYVGLRSAIIAGRPVTENSRLGTAYADFAAELIGKTVVHDTSLAGKLKSLWGIRETTSISN